MKSIDWCKALIEKHGPKHAYFIIITTGKALMGESNMPNPHWSFYKQAKRYMEKNYSGEI
jgi:hypothetical protein